MRDAARRIRAAGKSAGIIHYEAADYPRYLELGFNFLGIGTQTEVATADGGGDRERAREAFGAALAVACGLGLALAAGLFAAVVGDPLELVEPLEEPALFVADLLRQHLIDCLGAKPFRPDGRLDDRPGRLPRTEPADLDFL